MKKSIRIGGGIAEFFGTHDGNIKYLESLLRVQVQIKDDTLTIDGADEVDPQKNLIKGGGGALLREKILAIHSKQYIIVVDESKMVKQLGKFPLPVEIAHFGSKLTMKKIEQLGCEVKLRKKKDEVFISDNGNLIVDCTFGSIKDVLYTNEKLHSIAGVIETGLFVGFTPTIIVGHSNGNVQVI